MEPFDLSQPEYDSWYPKTCELKQTQETTVKGLLQKTLVPAPSLPDSIDCNIQPSGGRQVQLGPTQFKLSSHEIFLRGHFPQITSAMIAVAEGKQHEILLIENDGADCCTVLLTRSL